jgi:hypothetical protein
VRRRTHDPFDLADDPFDLAAEPQLGPLLAFEVAVILAINALRARYVQLRGAPGPHEAAEIAVARHLVDECDRARRAVEPYRRRVRRRRRHERLQRDPAGLFDDDM